LPGKDRGENNEHRPRELSNDGQCDVPQVCGHTNENVILTEANDLCANLPRIVAWFVQLRFVITAWSVHHKILPKMTPALF
jgi:hypothetical protein